MTASNHSTPRTLRTILAFFILLSITACTSGLIPGGFLNRSTEQAGSSQSVDVTEVTFSVTPPSLDDKNSDLALEVLDEVTGLALNPVRYALKPQADGTYSVQLPFQVGSVIKYRYLRTSDNRAVEVNGLNLPVRYRLFYVSGPSLVARDSILAWNDQPFQGETGRLRGQAINQVTNEPVVNAMVAAGGSYTFTASDGSFILENLPPGELNVVVVSLDGEYQPFQQGAVIVGGATTPATVSMNPAPVVNITFSMKPPAGGTSSLPVRMIGNTYSLGNTFADLSGGFSTVAARAPLMTLQPDGSYSLTLQLHVGTDLHYKYTQGDGFWNSELTSKGHFQVRQLIVPDADTTINEQVDSWTAEGYAPVTFSVKVPETTPAGEMVSIQFNPYGWTPAIPMWSIGSNEWVYILNSPLHLLGNITYRYCRNDQCDSDGASSVQPGNHTEFSFTPGQNAQTFQDVVQTWSWSDTAQLESVTVPDITPRDPSFVAGVEFQPGYDPTWQPYLSNSLSNISGIGSNWVVFSPEWTATQMNPPLLQLVPGRNPLWQDSNQAISIAKQQGLQVALYPHTSVAGDAAAFWSNATQEGWWSIWFDRYSRFLLNYADLAQQSGAQAIILDEPQVESAISLPADAAGHISGLIRDIRTRFSGEIWWAVRFNGSLQPPSPWMLDSDRIYLEWSAPLSQSELPTLDEMTAEFSRQLDENVAPFEQELGKPIILALNLPSASGAVQGCIQAGDGCLNLDLLNQPNSGMDGIQVNLIEQADAYNAALHAVNGFDWIGGFVSQGYYPPLSLQDPSASVHGKPAADVLWYWFPRLTGKAQ